jgi:hypothetical protein
MACRGEDRGDARGNSELDGGGPDPRAAAMDQQRLAVLQLVAEDIALLVGLYPIVASEKQLLTLLGNLI